MRPCIIEDDEGVLKCHVTYVGQCYLVSQYDKEVHYGICLDCISMYFNMKETMSSDSSDNGERLLLILMYELRSHSYFAPGIVPHTGRVDGSFIDIDQVMVVGVCDMSRDLCPLMPHQDIGSQITSHIESRTSAPRI